MNRELARDSESIVTDKACLSGWFHYMLWRVELDNLIYFRYYLWPWFRRKMAGDRDQQPRVFPGFTVFHLQADESVSHQSAGILRLDQWYHIAAVSGKAGIKLYLNGVLVGECAYTGSFSDICLIQ